MAFGIVTTDRGDVRALTDELGVAFAFYAYDAYGNPRACQTRATSLDATTSAEVASANILRYAGYAYDAHSGLYYCSARYYDPATASFITKDPAKADGEESAYQYCGGDPVGRVAPSGGKWHLFKCVHIGPQTARSKNLVRAAVGGIGVTVTTLATGGIGTATKAALYVGGMLKSGISGFGTFKSGDIISCLYEDHAHLRPLTCHDQNAPWIPRKYSVRMREIHWRWNGEWYVKSDTLSFKNPLSPIVLSLRGTPPSSGVVLLKRPQSRCIYTP